MLTRTLGLFGTLANGLTAGIVSGLTGNGEGFGTDANAVGLIAAGGSILGLAPGLFPNTNPLPQKL